LRFPNIPDIDVVLINHPDQPAWGVGEPPTLTTTPTIANAIFDASGARLRDIPTTDERLKAALAIAWAAPPGGPGTVPALYRLRSMNRPPSAQQAFGTL
jgi:hypothetical protein